MEIISPQLVAKASELPSAVLLVTAAIGPLLWVLGWRVHRALFVAAATVAGGVYGLAHGPALGLYPIVAGMLLSLSAAGLALAMLRIGVFLVFGALADYAVSAAVIEHVDEPTRGWARVVAFLAAGLLSLTFYRLLIMVTTSFAGAFLFLLGGLAFAARHGEADTLALASDRQPLIAAALIVLGLLGTAGQYVLERQRAQQRRDRSRDPAGELLRQILKAKVSQTRG
jgi:hypothetical protein